MTKRDTIIIAVLVNAGLLALLFATAMNLEDNTISKNSEVAQITELDNSYNGTSAQPGVLPTQTIIQTTSGDEVDNVLNQFAAQSAQNPYDSSQKTSQSQISNTPYDVSNDLLANTVETVLPSAPEKKQAEPTNSSTVEITVKRGDSLDKIARANGTSIDSIMKLNNLKSDRLDIGQVLKVPLSTKKSTETPKNSSSTNSTPTAPKKPPAKEVASTDPQYYTIKSGDNPWKIARQFHVKFEDLLKLNNLDEEKARNLKVGDKIRVK